MTLDLKFYLQLFLRRLHYFLLVAIPVAAVGVVVAMTLPAMYRAEARLLVESAQIPGDLAESTVRTGASEQLQIIQQRILTRANLLEMARRFDVYPPGNAMSPDERVRDMRDRIGLRLPGWRDAASFVTVSFLSADATQSAQVTNELVSQILARNVELRTATAGQTLDFFQQEVERLGEDLALQGIRILDFKEANQDALPESLEFRRTRQTALQERVLLVDRELDSLRDRRDRLELLYERTGQTETPSRQISPQQQELTQLRVDLDTALATFSEQNPRVAALRGRISALETAVAAQQGEAVETGGEETTPLSDFDLQIADIDGQIEFLTDQKARIETELASLEETIAATPSNTIALSTLERDYENIRVQYNQATARLAEASTGDRIEAQSRGQRIAVIEQAIVPTEPSSPNRKQIAAAGIGGGIALGFGLVFLLEVLDRSIRRPADITRELGIAPFGAVPFIRTRGETLRRRAVILTAFLAVAVGIPGGLYWVHVNVMPMDMVIDRVIDRTGLGPLIAQLRSGFAG